MPTPWHNAFVATMAGTDAWIGVTSESPIGKHFVWSNGMPLKYANWRDLHPTHQDIVGADTREGVKMIKWYSRKRTKRIINFKVYQTLISFCEVVIHLLIYRR